MKNVFILSGGMSDEYDPNLLSADCLFENMKDYSPNFSFFRIFILKDGSWVFGLDHVSCSFQKIDDSFFIVMENNSIKVDFIFPFIMGKGQENGELHGFFEIFGFKNYFGNNLSSSALTFDKIFSKRIVESLNFCKVVPYIDYSIKKVNYFEAVEILQSENLFLKPSDNGSSFGCFKVKNSEEFDFAIKEISKISSFILIEKFLNEKIEFSCAILYDELSEVGQSASSLEFLDYDNKYLIKNGCEFTLSLKDKDFVIDKIKEYTMQLSKIFRLKLARIDFFLWKNEIYFNEINSVPGMTNSSWFWILFEKKYDKKTLCNKILDNFLNKNY